MTSRSGLPSQQPPRRVPRPALTRTRFYRAAVPVFLVVLAGVMLLLLLLAAGVLLGILPYPGK